MEKSVFTPEYELLLSMLREVRRKQKVTQVELAKRIEETQSEVSKIERGEKRLDLIELQTFCHALGISLVDFVTDFANRQKKFQSSGSVRVPKTKDTRS